MEVWKTIKNSNYKISNMGNVLKPNNKLIKFRTKNYRRFEYEDLNGILHSAFVHRIVALYFCNPPEGTGDNGICEGYNVHHKNRIKYDNRAENLVYLTIEEHNDIHSKLRKSEKAKKEPIEELPLWKTAILVNY